MLKTLFVSSSLALSLAGCAGLTDDYDSSDNVVVREDGGRYDRYDRYDRPRYNVEDSRGPTIDAVDAGVSRDAREILRDRHNDTISYQMPHPGILYVFDRDRHRLVFSGRLHDGERFTVDRRSNRGALNGRVIFDHPGHFDAYRFYVLFPGMRD